MVDRQVWIHRQSVSVCVCWIMNWLLLDFILGLGEPLAEREAKKGIEEKERGATESGGVGWDIIPPRAPSRGGWARTNNHWLAKGVKDRKRRVSPQCRHSLIPAQDRIERIALVCVCVWLLRFTRNLRGTRPRSQKRTEQYQLRLSTSQKSFSHGKTEWERDWLTHRQEKHSIGTTETHKRQMKSNRTLTNHL